MNLLLNNSKCFPFNPLDPCLSNFDNLLNCLSQGYCSYINKKGKNKNKICGRKLNKNRELCFEHYYNSYKKKNKIKIQKNQQIESEYLFNPNSYYFNEYKKYLYNLDNYDYIIYEKYSNEYLVYKEYLDNIYFNYDETIIKKYKEIDVIKCKNNSKEDLIYPAKDMENIEKKNINKINYESFYYVKYLKNIESILTNDDSYIDYIKDILNIESKEFNEKSIQLNNKNVKLDKVDENSKNIKKKSNSNKNKRKKELKKFKIKYDKLLETNRKNIKWCYSNLKTDYYIERVKNIIYSNIYFLNEKIKKDGKYMEDIRNTYSCIYSELWNSWEMDVVDEKDDKHDLNLILKQNWEDYSIYEYDN